MDEFRSIDTRRWTKLSTSWKAAGLYDTRIPVDKGATIFIPKGAWHGFDKGDKEMLLLWIVVPPGLEGLFREIASKPGEPPKQFSLEQLNEIGRRYGGTEYK